MLIDHKTFGPKPKPSFIFSSLSFEKLFSARPKFPIVSRFFFLILYIHINLSCLENHCFLDINFEAFVSPSLIIGLEMKQNSDNHNGVHKCLLKAFTYINQGVFNIIEAFIFSFDPL